MTGTRETLSTIAHLEAVLCMCMCIYMCVVCVCVCMHVSVCVCVCVCVCIHVSIKNIERILITNHYANYVKVV